MRLHAVHTQTDPREPRNFRTKNAEPRDQNGTQQSQYLTEAAESTETLVFRFRGSKFRGSGFRVPRFRVLGWLRAGRPSMDGCRLLRRTKRVAVTKANTSRKPRNARKASVFRVVCAFVARQRNLGTANAEPRNQNPEPRNPGTSEPRNPSERIPHGSHGTHGSAEQAFSVYRSSLPPFQCLPCFPCGVCSCRGQRNLGTQQSEYLTEATEHTETLSQSFQRSFPIEFSVLQCFPCFPCGVRSCCTATEPRNREPRTLNPGTRTRNPGTTGTPEPKSAFSTIFPIESSALQCLPCFPCGVCSCRE